MLCVGHSLVTPQLANKQQLDAEGIHRQFGSKVVWLLQTRDLTTGKFKVFNHYLATDLIGRCLRLKAMENISGEIVQIEI